MLTLKVGSIFLRIEEHYQELANVQTVFKKIQENAENKIEEIIETPEYGEMVVEELENWIR